MTKKLAAEIHKTLNALHEIEQDQIQTYLRMDKRTKAAKTVLAVATEARTLSETLTGIWAKTRQELRKLAGTPDFAPIHDLLLEVIACKVEAANRRRVERAKELAKAYSLEERAHFRS